MVLIAPERLDWDVLWDERLGMPSDFLNQKLCDSALLLAILRFTGALVFCTMTNEILPLRYCWTLVRISVSSMLISSDLYLERTLPIIEILSTRSVHLGSYGDGRWYH